MNSKAIIQFSNNWQQNQEGAIERGGKLIIDYAKERLSCCFRDWRGAEIGGIMVYLRFHPRGEVVSGSVINAIRAGETTQGPVIGHESALFSIIGLKPPASSWLALADKMTHYEVCHGIQVRQSYGFPN